MITGTTTGRCLSEKIVLIARNEHMANRCAMGGDLRSRCYLACAR